MVMGSFGPPLPTITETSKGPGCLNSTVYIYTYKNAQHFEIPFSHVDWLSATGLNERFHLLRL